MFQQVAFAMSIPLDLYGFYPYTKNSTYLSHTLAVIPSNACTLRITAAAGTELAGAYSLDTVIIFSNKRSLQS